MAFDEKEARGKDNDESECNDRQDRSRKQDTPGIRGVEISSITIGKSDGLFECLVHGCLHL